MTYARQFLKRLCKNPEYKISLDFEGTNVKDPLSLELMEQIGLNPEAIQFFLDQFV